MIKSHQKNNILLVFFIILLPRQAFSIIASTGRVVRYVRAELSGYRLASPHR